jgi:predicted transcriptional regulator YdeE
MKTTIIEQYYIIGMAIRTTNENGQSGIDIPLLWHTFMTENIAAQIPNKVDNTVYSVYTDYELDHTKPYTTIFGCRVSSLNEIPQGLTGTTIEGGKYAVITAKGRLSDNIVFNEWQKIWSADIPRTFKADFEVYGTKAQNPADAEVDIFLSVS